MWKKSKACRACGNSDLKLAFSLGVQFPANDFKAAGEMRLGAAPLEVMFCERCTNSQLSVVVDPMLLYKDYPYVTSNSQQMQRHFAKLWEIANLNPTPGGKTILEIGSNDGAFLEYCWRHGAVNVVGIDPAINLESLADDRGIGHISGLFCEGTARYAVDMLEGVLPDLVFARHVFAHIDNWKEFVANLEIVCGDDTTVIIEAPYIGDTLERCEFDQIYHEHLSYVSLGAMNALLKDSPFCIVDVRRFEVHGGAIAIFLQRKNSRAIDAVDKCPITLGRWRDFERNARTRIHNAFIFKVDHSKRVVGFGASAKSSVWIQACGLTKADIAFICDNTPFKQGKLSPGTDIPIVPESELTRDNADIAINFAWQYHDEIVRKHKAWVDAGGVFINPHQL